MSPTMVTPQEVIAAAKGANLPWIAWAWDDNDEAGGKSSENGFSMTLTGPGYYDPTGAAPYGLTNYGTAIVAALKGTTRVI